MAVTIETYETQGLAVARCEGAVLEFEILEAVDFSFQTRRMPLGIDRIAYVAPTADLRALDADALYRIQAHVFDLSGGDGIPAFRSVLVTPSPFHRPIAELYKAIWDSHRLPGVEFSVVTTPEEAARHLRLTQGRELLMRLAPSIGNYR